MVSLVEYFRPKSGYFNMYIDSKNGNYNVHPCATLPPMFDIAIKREYAHSDEFTLLTNSFTPKITVSHVIMSTFNNVSLHTSIQQNHNLVRISNIVRPKFQADNNTAMVETTIYEHPKITFIKHKCNIDANRELVKCKRVE